jgi:dipeptide transport system permease protein
MFTSAVFVETVFAWPGIGTMMVEAVQRRDYPVLQAGAFIVGGTFVLLSWIVDTLYGIVDPRIKIRSSAAR